MCADDHPRHVARNSSVVSLVTHYQNRRAIYRPKDINAVLQVATHADEIAFVNHDINSLRPLDNRLGCRYIGVPIAEQKEFHVAESFVASRSDFRSDLTL